ncbi:unnamed protein product [Closterium sp. NIES-54]
MGVWGPVPVGGTDQERCFLLVVDDYTCYTTIFPLHRKADVSGVLIPWIRAISTSGTVSLSRWTGKVGDASVFRVWGTLSLVRDAKASKLSSRTLRYVFLGFPTDAPPWEFYHPHKRRVFSSQDVTRIAWWSCSLRCVLVEPLEISSDSSSPAEGGDPAADDTAATRRSPRLENPPGFPPRPSSPPPQPAAVDSGAETAGADLGDAETEGEGLGGAAPGGAGSGVKMNNRDE